MQKNTQDQNAEMKNAPSAKRVAFRMQLFEGLEEEYRKRHDAIWPELKDLLRTAGVSDYSIFFDKATNHLIGVMNVDDFAALDDLPSHPVMKKWWTHMKDIMETNEDESPVTVSLEEIFYLP